MKLAGGNTFTGAQTGTLANYEAFKLTGSGTNQMYFNLTPGRDFRAGDNNTFVNVDSSSVSLFANSGTNYATFYAYPAGNIFTRADKGFVMDGDVVINTGHKLGWNSVSSSMYPTPTTNSEYVTKGWTDLTYAKKGGVGWSDVTSKPFNTLGTGFYITDGALNADYANPPWSYIRNKPFSTIGDGLSVTDGVLSATGGGGSTTWDNVTEKPFSSIGTGLNVVDGALNTESAAPLWSSVGRKPFSTIGKGLVVAGDELQADASEVLYRYDNVGSSDVRLRRFVAGELNIELNMLSSNNSANLVASDLELDRLAMVQAYTSANLMLAVRNPPSKYTYINLRDSTIELFSGYACAHLINTGSSFAYIKENEYIVKAWADSKYAFKNGELAGTSASWHDVVQYLILFALVIERIVSLRRKSKKSVL
jgi:hypothetical protein